GFDVVSSGRSSSQREAEPAMAAAGRSAATARSAARMRDTGNTPTPAPDPGAQPARRADQTAKPPVADDNGDGWLSDLLNHADTAERDVPRGRQASPAAAANPLDSLSLDIGRLMDRKLVGEMWDRYQRGERKAFTKRLYTPAGQKAFDEVARKYRTDRAFKQTADRYVAEFERLLDEVARDEREPSVIRDHLISETGLVYTLLAHAAGRLA
ncbi:MAG TPA: methyl-accepting chemotaxis protein, partial [Nitrobacter sp.]|nr:methyl-accepting chemotaxis protein [Nitrobacter sp.]